MTDVDIHIADNDSGRRHYKVGDTVSGVVDILVHDMDVPLSNVNISFHCLGEVKFLEHPNTPYYHDGFVYFDKFCYLDRDFPIPDAASRVVLKNQKASIPFEFTIPTCKDLPSTMISSHGFIQYFVRVGIRIGPGEVLKYVKEVIVEAPITDEAKLLVGVSSTVEKDVLLHNGNVKMHASIDRKGFAPGEVVEIHVAVDNKTNTKVIPRASIYQVQVYQCGDRHKAIENILGGEPVFGEEVAANSENADTLAIKIPPDEALSFKSSCITVRYFVHVTLDIKNSFDLHCNLPIIVTSTDTIRNLKNAKAHK